MFEGAITVVTCEAFWRVVSGGAEGTRCGGGGGGHVGD